MSKFILKCSRCGKLLDKTHIDDYRTNHFNVLEGSIHHIDNKKFIFVESDLKRYLHKINVSSESINNAFNYTPLSGEYNECCFANDLYIEQINHFIPLERTPAERLNDDTHKDNRGLEYMNNLYDKYASHWNNEDEGND